jgi:hypothetical protein
MVLRAHSCSEERSPCSKNFLEYKVTAHGVRLLNRTREPTFLEDPDVYLETEGVTLRLRRTVIGSTEARVQSLKWIIGPNL